MMKWLTKMFNKEKPMPPYPIPFAIVIHTAPALEMGIKDDQNKMIVKYFYDKYGNVVTKRYAFSPQRVWTFEQVQRIPVYDKTTGEDRFPVFARPLPMEVEFNIK